MKNIRSLVALAIFAMTLNACSGGGESASTVPPAPDPNLTVPVQTAFANIVRRGLDQSFNISGSVDNSTPTNPMPPIPVTGNGHLTLAPASPSMLCNAPVSSAVQTVTGTATASGTSVPINSTGTVYYRDDNTVAANSFGGKTFLFDHVTYPATVKAGDSGQTGNGRQVDSNCNQLSFGSSITGSYVASTDTANSLLVKFTSIQTDQVGGSDRTDTVYRINTAGDVTLVSITTVRSFLASAFQTLTFNF